MPDSNNISSLLAIMARLRAADGCPWDREQTFDSIAPYTIEEAYEVADAIAHKDMAGLKEELGDLLFQTVFHAQMAQEQGAFTFADVVEAVCEKMIRRHPHVFADAKIADASAQTAAWEEHKARERAVKPGGDTRQGLLDEVPLNLPALTRAAKLQKRAARVGFDWPDISPVLDKIREEIDELSVEINSGANSERITDELGDVLFAMVNVSRHLQIDPETALRNANMKFERRFGYIERRLKETGKQISACALEELDALWNEAKGLEINN